MSFDTKLEGFTNDSVIMRDPSTEHPVSVLQVKYVHVKSRTTPLMVVGTTDGVMVVDQLVGDHTDL